MPIFYFYKTYNNKAEWEKNNNKCIELACNDEIEEDEEYETKESNNASKIMKGKGF